MKYYYFEQVYRLYIDFERYHKAAYNTVYEIFDTEYFVLPDILIFPNI